MFRLRIKYWTRFQGVVYHNKSSSVDLFDSRVPKDPSTSLLETLEDMAANGGDLVVIFRLIRVIEVCLYT